VGTALVLEETLCVPMGEPDDEGVADSLAPGDGV
jgi:hypothetical protein